MPNSEAQTIESTIKLNGPNGTVTISLVLFSLTSLHLTHLSIKTLTALYVRQLALGLYKTPKGKRTKRKYVAGESNGLAKNGNC
jgi:hypothetical protein